MLSGACVLWLERLQPLFVAVALGSAAYEVWLVKLRPPALRKRGTKAMLAVSLALNAIVIVGWIAISLRYR